MNPSIEDIQKLRRLTGVGITDAKKALENAKGDFNKALAAMRKKGFAKAETRAARDTLSGLIGTYNHDGRIGVVVEVDCETDFVARNEDFKNFVNDIAMHIAATNPEYISISDVTDDVKQLARTDFMNDVKSENKPPDLVEKIVNGQLNKYFAEKCLLEQPFVKKPDETVGDYVKKQNSIFGENIVIRRFYRIALRENQ